ncbi:hypothetical protein Q7C36_021289 [Tachysurus vachellii]|uniref:Uncharacterized protein n=1 Tax=Tachysurus vachellii TaxID=175792 RepID=A0AA88IS02_TACVA|nr:hypothetical protein Q7C36_021289 [Tachysurus vachellii]
MRKEDCFGLVVKCQVSGVSAIKLVIKAEHEHCKLLELFTTPDSSLIHPQKNTTRCFVKALYGAWDTRSTFTRWRATRGV